jgi:hypothetical protein
MKNIYFDKSHNNYMLCVQRKGFIFQERSSNVEDLIALREAVLEDYERTGLLPGQDSY